MWIGNNLRYIYLFFAYFCLLESKEYNYARMIDTGIEKEIVICIPSYNNELYYKKNLDSIFSQEYENFKVLYVDDASTDKTGELVLQYIKDNGLEEKLFYFQNETNQGAMSNLIRMIYSLPDSVIVINLDGDDFLAHSGVLKRVNAAYADPDVWVTYGCYETYPDKKRGHPIPLTQSQLKNREYRKLPFYWSHLRTYYAGCFKKIPRSWFLESGGKFLSMAPDVPIMLGLLDLCHEHVFFIPSILYLYNRENVLNEDKRGKRLQQSSMRQTYRRPPLEKLREIPF